MDSNGEDVGLEAFPCDSEEENCGGDLCVPGEHLRAAQLSGCNSVAEQCSTQEPARVGPWVAAACRDQ